MRNLHREERGQGLVEYALILALVSLAAIVALTFLSGKINDLFSKAGNSLNTVSVAGGTGTGTGTGSGTGPGPSVPSPGTVSISCGGGCPDGATMTATTGSWNPGSQPILSYQYTWDYEDSNSSATCATAGIDFESSLGSDSHNAPDIDDTEQADDFGSNTDPVRVRVWATNSVGQSTAFAVACVDL